VKEKEKDGELEKLRTEKGREGNILQGGSE
jgi:hypothetical protein